jgi:hypothetical protein
MHSDDITSRTARVDADDTTRITVLRLRPDRTEPDDGLDEPTPQPAPLHREPPRRG